MNIENAPLTVRASSILAFTLWLASTAATHAAVLRVPADHPTLQLAVDAASSGDEIRIAAGVYQQSARVLGKQLLIVGEEGAVLQAWPGLNANAPTGLLEAGLGSHLTVRGLKFDGARIAEANPQNNLLGMFFLPEAEWCRTAPLRGFAEPQNSAVCRLCQPAPSPVIPPPIRGRRSMW